jgi:hypothetical protein
MEDYSYLPTRGGGASIGGWQRGQNPIFSALQRAKQQYDYEEQLRRERHRSQVGAAMQAAGLGNSFLGNLGQLGGGIANVAGVAGLGTAASSSEPQAATSTLMLGDKAKALMPKLDQLSSGDSPPNFQVPQMPIAPTAGLSRRQQVPWWVQQYYMGGY